MFTDAAAYDRFMGRFSSRLAVAFADFAGVHPPARALDVGCGPGALTAVQRRHHIGSRRGWAIGRSRRRGARAGFTMVSSARDRRRRRVGSVSEATWSEEIMIAAARRLTGVPGPA